MKYLPTRGRVLVRPDEAIEERPSGIVIPAVAQETIQTGRVLEVGDGTDEHPRPDYWDGRRVVFSKYGGIEIKTPQGVTLLVLKFDDVLLLIEED